MVQKKRTRNNELHAEIERVFNELKIIYSEIKYITKSDYTPRQIETTLDENLVIYTLANGDVSKKDTIAVMLYENVLEYYLLNIVDQLNEAAQILSSLKKE